MSFLSRISSFLGLGGKRQKVAAIESEYLIERSEHNISRKQLDKNALDVLYGLHRAGYSAYLVGGSVRDLLLGIEPKDFDVVTDALPEEVKKVFGHRCQLIGRRFRLAHIRFGRKVIEVATFRGSDDEKGARETDSTGRLVRDNVFGTLQEDVWRRDFTVNALYYNIADFSVVDYTNALADLNAGQLRLIGDPETRYREDPVRMIRAVRFAAKLGFTIEKATDKPIKPMGNLLASVAPARLFEEVLKLFHSGVGVVVLDKLRKYDLLVYLFPLTEGLLQQDVAHSKILVETLKSTDKRIAEDLPVNPAFLFAAFLWEPMMQRRELLLEQGEIPQDAMHAAANEVFSLQVRHTAIPKRFTAQVRDIWSLQFRIMRYSGKRAANLRAHPRFRAAYDFLGIRVAAGEENLRKTFDWWTDYQEQNPIDRARENFGLKPDRPRKRRTNRNPYRRRRED